jgi:hypothetical protein
MIDAVILLLSLAAAGGAPAPPATPGARPHHHQDAAQPAPGHRAESPDAGLEEREVKGLAPDELRQARAGEGMGLALAAELNGYPGPKHVLELAAPLALDEAQRAAVQAAYDRMHAAAVRLGERWIEAEARLDRVFAEGGATAAAVDAAVAESARLRGELRAAHLRAHLETAAVLRDEQIARYAELRGYRPAGPPADPGRGGRPRR